MRNLNILLVEDNQADSFYICEILQDVPTIKIYTVESLSQAIKLCHQRKYDLVLLDLFLTDSSQGDTFFNFKAAHPFVPVIVLTGLNDSELGLDTVAKGAEDYIVKGDINPQSLLRTIYFAYERSKRIDHNENSKVFVTNLTSCSIDNERALELLRKTAMKIKMLHEEDNNGNPQSTN